MIASDVASILNLPWELLRPPGRDFLGCDLTLPIRRLPRANDVLSPFNGALPARPLRILFVACAPSDQATLDYEREEQALLQAIASAGNNVAFDSGDLGTFEELRDRINEFQPHVVHLTGHGIVRDDGLGYFAFEDERGHTDLHSSEQIRNELFAGSTVQCAFISGCQSGKTPPVDAIGGICQGLVSTAVPLAIGWAASIADDTATNFAATFYKTLASGQPVDRALTQARQAIFKQCAERGDPSWTLPVLYAASTQSQVFDPNLRRAAEPPPRPNMLQDSLDGMNEQGRAEQFVGRRRELQRLLPKLRTGELHAVVLTGIGGAGKSTLATRLARRLETDGFRIIAISSTNTNPLSSARLLDVFGRAFREAADDHEAGGDDVLARRLRIVDKRISDPQQPVAQRLQDAVGMLKQARFVLVLDNLEVNLDEQSRSFLDSDMAAFYTDLVRNPLGQSRAIVTSRYLPADLPQLPMTAREEQLGDFPYSAFLKFLLRDDVVEQRYRSGGLSTTLLQQLHRLLGGTPRFLLQIREVLRDMPADDLRAALQQSALPADATPDRLTELRNEYCNAIVTARLYSYLPAESQQALCRAAVYGVAVSFEGLAAVTRLPAEPLPAMTREWQQRALAFPERERGSGELWSVYPVLRGWLLHSERLSDEDRIAAHRAAGDYLRDMDQQEREGELGLIWTDCLLEARAQYMAAGVYDLAREVTARISGAYSRRGLYGEQERLNRELLEHDDHPVTHLWLGRSFDDRGDYKAARAEYQRAQELSQTAGDQKNEAATWHQLASVDLEEGNYPAARASFQQAQRLTQAIGDQAGAAATLHALATVDLEEGNYPAARASFQQALAIKQAIGDQAGAAATLHALATVDLEEGNYPAARASFQQALQDAQAIGDQAGAAATLHALATVDLEEGNYPAARAGFQRALQMRQAIGDQAGEAATWHNLASVDMNEGKYGAARAGFQRALQMRQAIGDQAGAAQTWHNLASVDMNEGKYGAARAGFQRALQMRQAIGDQAGAAQTWHNLASVDMNEGKYGAARAGFQRAQKIMQAIGDQAGAAQTWHNLASVDMNEGKYGAARAGFQRAQKIMQAIGDQAGAAQTWHNLASVDMNEGKYGAARAGFQRALQMRQAIGDQAGAAATLHALATVDLEEGNYPAARAGFQRALQMRQAIGDQAGAAATWHNLATVDVYEGKYGAARASFQRALQMRQAIGDKAGEAATWANLGIMAAQQEQLDAGLRLVALSFLLLQSIGHAQLQQVQPWVVKLASQLNYTQEQFDAMIKEVVAAYQQDRGAALLRAAVGEEEC